MEKLESQLNIYEYSDPTEFLRDLLKRKQKLNPRFSLRACSHQLGLKNHVLLSLILNDKRRLKPQVAKTIRSALNLTPKEQRYFDLLVLHRNAETIEERELYEEALSSFHPEKQFSVMKSDMLRCLTDWAHIAVLELVKLKNFKEDPEFIVSRLGGEITPEQAKHIINRLIHTQLLKRDSNGALIQCTDQRVTDFDVPTESVRRVQAEFLARAKTALEEQNIHEREFLSFTFSLRSEDIQAAKTSIREFYQSFAKSFDSSSGDEVYQLGVQLYRITRKEGDRYDH
ncbi:MAG: TIGR02147 family protein [Bdellovibrionota bacterium]